MSPPDDMTLSKVARAALGDPGAVVLSWSCEPVQWQAIARTTGAIERYSGTADGGRRWSAVRKVLTRPSGASGGNWEREAVIYASGMLGDLPGIRAPRCHHIERGPDQGALWLEHVTDTVGAGARGCGAIRLLRVRGPMGRNRDPGLAQLVR